jgi:hypothetical protein
VSEIRNLEHEDRASIDPRKRHARPDLNLQRVDVDATHWRGGDEDDPTVLEEPGPLKGPRRLTVRLVQHHHRLAEPAHVLRYILDGIAPVVGYLFDLTEIDGDIDIRRSGDTRSQAALVFLCQCPPGDDVGTCLRTSDPFDDCHANDPSTRELAAQSSKRGRAAAWDELSKLLTTVAHRHDPSGRRGLSGSIVRARPDGVDPLRSIEPGNEED